MQEIRLQTSTCYSVRSRDLIGLRQQLTMTQVQKDISLDQQKNSKGMNQVPYSPYIYYKIHQVVNTKYHYFLPFQEILYHRYTSL